MGSRSSCQSVWSWSLQSIDTTSLSLTESRRRNVSWRHESTTLMTHLDLIVRLHFAKENKKATWFPSNLNDAVQKWVPDISMKMCCLRFLAHSRAVYTYRFLAWSLNVMCEHLCRTTFNPFLNGEKNGLKNVTCKQTFRLNFNRTCTRTGIIINWLTWCFHMFSHYNWNCTCTYT